MVELVMASGPEFISFNNASNNTHCEGRVVWTQKGPEPTLYESGIDIQRWGGGIPGQAPSEVLGNAKLKKDRRAKPR